MKKEQSSIEWLIEEILGVNSRLYKDEIKQAKELHKKESKEMFNAGGIYALGYHKDFTQKNPNFEQYYNEKYGQ